METTEGNAQLTEPEEPIYRIGARWFPTSDPNTSRKRINTKCRPCQLSNATTGCDDRSDLRTRCPTCVARNLSCWYTFHALVVKGGAALPEWRQEAVEKMRETRRSLGTLNVGHPKISNPTPAQLRRREQSKLAKRRAQEKKNNAKQTSSKAFMSADPAEAYGRPEQHVAQPVSDKQDAAWEPELWVSTVLSDVTFI